VAEFVKMRKFGDDADGEGVAGVFHGDEGSEKENGQEK